MISSLMLKGFEVELFTGRSDGSNVGVSELVSRELDGFVTEPDRRNLEFTTAPIANYLPLREELLRPRRVLRRWLTTDGLTLLPGSTLSLGDENCFERSDPSNPYHDLIEAAYGTRVVTASVHINLGITDLSLLFRALRLVRCEAALFLSLSASSPFLGGRICGPHSQRWRQFPLTPPQVPLFLGHEHYCHWVEQQLRTGTMQNIRHLWTSVRPNGPGRPHNLNRLELRICDLVTDPDLLIAITALLELRLLTLDRYPEQLDPLKCSHLNADRLATLSDDNDQAAASRSLDADLCHWRDGQPVRCRDWITSIVEEVTPLASELGLQTLILPLEAVLQEGNQAMRWLAAVRSGSGISEVLHEGIRIMEQEENPISEAALG